MFENFNAGAAVVHITGVNVHPGSAQDVMVHAAQAAAEEQAALAGWETPRGSGDS